MRARPSERVSYVLCEASAAAPAYPKLTANKRTGWHAKRTDGLMPVVGTTHAKSTSANQVMKLSHAAPRLLKYNLRNVCVHSTNFRCVHFTCEAADRINIECLTHWVGRTDGA
jgi:hypothetical protein